MRNVYKICSNCGQVHQTIHSFKDKTPRCYTCGSYNFKDERIKQSDLPDFVPVFCDWQLQGHVDKASEDLLDYVLEHNKAEMTSNLKDAFKQYFVFAANTNRRGFVSAMDNFRSYMQGDNG